MTCTTQPSLRSSTGQGEPFVWLAHPGASGVAFKLVPLVASIDWPPDAPRRLGCPWRIANGRQVGNRQRGRRLLSRRVANYESELLELLADVLALGGEVTWGNDLAYGGAAPPTPSCSTTTSRCTTSPVGPSTASPRATAASKDSPSASPRHRRSSTNSPDSKTAGLPPSSWASPRSTRSPRAPDQIAARTPARHRNRGSCPIEPGRPPQAESPSEPVAVMLQRRPCRNRQRWRRVPRDDTPPRGV